MANTDDLKRRTLRWAQQVEQNAATQMVNRLSKDTPRISGQMERSRRRRDSGGTTTFSTKVTQPSGAGDRPDQLPNWLDVGRQFVIRPNRARVLRFRGLGGQIVFARQVLWNRSRRSQGFWSNVMNARNWRDELRAQAATTRLPD